MESTLTNGARSNHTSPIEQRREQERVDANRELSLQAVRSLQELIKRVTDRKDWYGKAHISLTIEAGRITQVNEIPDRAYRVK